MSLNPNAKIAKSRGIDLPVLKVYLAGRIAGNCIEKCVKWRRDIILHYRNWKTVTHETMTEAKVLSYDETYSYPIAFIDPLNSGEADSVDELGLTSAISKNMIYDKDILSVERADVIVANMDDFMEEGIEQHLISYPSYDTTEDLENAFEKLRDKITTRRPNMGTIEEVAIARYLRKPVILIVPESQKEIYSKHPFQGRASQIVTSVDELLNDKHLEILYKSIAGATV